MNRYAFQTAAFSKLQTEVLKGIGILTIVLHNFLHNLDPIIGENQFSYKYERYEKFYLTLVDNPLEIFRAAFSYFGHYGVQIFIFFSAYGLTRKYLSSDINTVSFLKSRAGKIYSSFLLCVAVYICLGIAKELFVTSEQVLYWDSLLWKLLLISNFLPGQAMMPVGPWWFMPFIFQLYLFFPLLLGIFKKYDSTPLLVISLASIVVEYIYNPYLWSNGLNFNYMIVGHLPVICAGIYLASKEKVSLGYGLIAASLLLFILGNYSIEAWILSDLTFTLLFLAATTLFINKIADIRLLHVPLVFYGGISFHLFMVNGFLRSPFHNFAESYNLWWVDGLCALASLAFSTLFAIGLGKLDQTVRTLGKKTA